MIFNYIINNFGEVLSKTAEHMQITLTAVLIAIIIGVPLGVVVSRSEKFGNGILTVANIFQTIPSLALFGFIIPIPIIGGIGYRPAVIILFLYALLPIIKNTYIGIQSIDESITESARGVGMTPMQTLFMVSLPLSFPVIMSGIRVATVINIGTTTIASLIGAGGLGDFIFRGISTSDNSIILAGAIPTTILALSVDYLLGLVEKKGSVAAFGRIATNKKTRKKIGASVLALIILIGGIVGYRALNEDQTIIIGSKNYTEARLEAEMVSTLIEEKTDYETEIKELGGTIAIAEALRTNELDLYVEYTGSAYIAILKYDTVENDPDKVYDIVKKEYQEKFDIKWLDPLGFNNTYTFAIKDDYAKQNNIKTFSDLAPLSDGLSLGAEIDFVERQDGYLGAEDLYGFDFKDIVNLDTGLKYDAMANNNVDVINAFTTDGRLAELNLTVLEDDKSYFPPYYPAPAIHNKSIEKYPDLEKAANSLSGSITEEEMQKLNYLVDVEKQDMKKVARDFLKEKGLVK